MQLMVQGRECHSQTSHQPHQSNVTKELSTQSRIETDGKYHQARASVVNLSRTSRDSEPHVLFSTRTSRFDSRADTKQQIWKSLRASFHSKSFLHADGARLTLSLHDKNLALCVGSFLHFFCMLFFSCVFLPFNDVSHFITFPSEMADALQNGWQILGLSAHGCCCARRETN